MRWWIGFGLMGCFVNPGGVPQYQDVDFVGATLDDKVLNGARACRDWCISRSDCVAYTFGGPAVDEPHRAHCYLKSAGFQFRRAKGFDSGIKR